MSQQMSFGGSPAAFASSPPCLQTNFGPITPYLLVDGGFAINTYCIPPFDLRGNVPDRVGAFNKMQSGARMKVECMFGQIGSAAVLPPSDCSTLPSSTPPTP